MQLLIENRESLDKISEYLYEHETITGKEFMKIFREIKGIPNRRKRAQRRALWNRQWTLNARVKAMMVNNV